MCQYLIIIIYDSFIIPSTGISTLTKAQAGWGGFRGSVMQEAMLAEA